MQSLLQKLEIVNVNINKNIISESLSLSELRSLHQKVLKKKLVIIFIKL